MISTSLAEDTDAKYSNKDLRETIDKFTSDYWLLSLGSNRYALHSRSILELSQYLVEIYGNQLIANCKLCKEIVISGVVCETCTTKMHRHCAKKYFKNQTDCLSCKRPLSEEQISMLRAPNRSSQVGSSSSGSQMTQKDVKNVTLLKNTQASDGTRRKNNN